MNAVNLVRVGWQVDDHRQGHSYGRCVGGERPYKVSQEAGETHAGTNSQAPVCFIVFCCCQELYIGV